MLKSVKLTTEYNETWITSVNGQLDDEEIKSYFLNKVFNIGGFPELQKVTKIEFLR